MSLFFKRATSVDPLHPRDPGLATLFGLAGSVLVNPRTAMKSTSVYACVKVLAETMGSLPLHLYQRKQDGREAAKTHPLHQLLRWRPNKTLTATEFWEMVTAITALRGNFVAYKKLVANGTQVEELLPLDPDRLDFVKYQGKLAYAYRPEQGGMIVYLPTEVFHVRGLTLDGFVGLNPIELHRQTIGADLTAREHGLKVLENSARPGGILEMENHFKDPKDKEAFKKAFHEATTGGNVAKTVLLEHGIKWRQISLNNSDLQYLENKSFTRTEIAAIFRVPPHLIGDLTHATYTNIEHQSIDFVRYTMLPWFTRVEQAISRDLLGDEERDTYYAEFLAENLLRGDLKTRSEIYAKGRQWGWYSANDVRRKENEDPIGQQGDEYLVPVNMRPADQPYTPPAGGGQAGSVGDAKTGDDDEPADGDPNAGKKEPVAAS